MKFSIMTREHGHTEEVFDKANIVSMKEAAERFNQLTSEGHSAFELTPEGNKPNRLKEFNPTIADQLFVPHIQGG